MNLRSDEAIDLYGHKTRVKYQGWYNQRNHIEGDYYLFYDEKEVYHIENASSKKIVQAFGCDSWNGAIQRALAVVNEMLK